MIEIKSQSPYEATDGRYSVMEIEGKFVLVYGQFSGMVIGSFDSPENAWKQVGQE